MIRALLQRGPEAPFLVTPDRSWSRAETGAEVALRAATPAESGPIVPLELQPDADGVLDLLAVLAAGRIAAPLNLREPEPVRKRLRQQLENAPVEAAPALLVRTSGSTGDGKWVWLDLPALLAGAEAAARALDFGAGDRWLLNLPLWHVGGLGPVWRALAGGGALSLPGAPFTHASVVATQLRRLLGDPLPEDYAACRRLLLGGGPVPPGLVDRAAATGLAVTASYGMTETGSLCVADGRALEGCELEISEDGEILVRGAALFRGYLDPATGRCERPDTEAGWFPTGDLGRLKEDGRLEVTGRRDNVFISGGENIQPERIERALLALPGIEQAIVVGVPDDEFGMRPVAFVAPLRDGLDDELTASLPGYAVPDRFLALPEAAGGAIKPRRADLQRLARAGFPGRS